MKFQLLIRSALFFSLTLMLPATSIAGSGKPTGEWQITTMMTIPGMGEMPAGSHRHCYDKDMIPRKEKSGEKCETLSQDKSGDTVTWHMRCTGSNGTTDITGKNTYSSDSMSGTMHISSADGEMDMKMSGKHLGPCH